MSQLNLTSSIFHNVSLEHLKHIPFYRISTPKAPIYQVEEERGRLSAYASKRRDKGISTQSASSSPSALGKSKIPLADDLLKKVYHDKYLGAPHPEDDDIYILPYENYSTMTIGNYVEMMTTKQNQAAQNPAPYHKLSEYGAEVFLVDEYTSVVYLQVAPSRS